MAFDPKYITYDNGIHSTILIFSCTERHVDMVRSLNIQPKDLIGAGFIKFGDDGILQTYGKSESLKINRSDRDDAILVQILGLRDLVESQTLGMKI